MSLINKKAFTLVELIVVITILAVLGTIAIVAFSGYSKNARDSARLSDIGNIKKTLELWILQSGVYPEPSNGTGVTFSGTYTLWTQGVFGDSTVQTVGKLDKKPVDPLFDSEYTYSVTASKKEYQIAAILEKDMAMQPNTILFSQTYAATSNATAYVSGNYNGILTTIEGTLTYIIALPSIILSDLSNTNIDGTSEYELVYNNKQNLPHSYANKNLTMLGEDLGFIPQIVWSGTGLRDLDNQTEFQELVSNLQTVFTGSLFASLPEYKSIVTTGAYSVEAMGAIKSIVESNMKQELTNVSEIAQNINSCKTTLPSCNGNSCQLTYNPNNENQDWIKGGSSCSYSCINDYTGDTCQTPPPTPTCGSDNEMNTISIPSNLCTSGTSSSVTDGGIGSTYTWTCSRNGFTPATCSANHISNPFTMVGGQITAYNVAIGGTDIIIPSSIDGVTVTSIGSSAFNNKGLTSVTFPNTITSIGWNSFNTNLLTSLTIPNSVTSIGDYAFRINSISSLTLPSSISHIGGYAFTNQSGNIGTVYGPSSGYAFNSFKNDSGYSFDKSKFKNYMYTCSVETCIPGIYTVDQSSGTIIEYNVTLGGTTPSIPSSIDGVTITTIGTSAFYNKGLTSVTFPNTITSIGESSFYTNEITSLTVPNSVTLIGTNAFRLNQITSLTIPNSVTSIGFAAFWMNKIDSLTLPSSVNSIGSYAFGNQSGNIGTVYGPSSGYVKDRYDGNWGLEFDKTHLATYISQ